MTAVVIGAGIVGAACAYELASRGVQTTVLDSSFEGGGATGAGMGHLVVMDDSPAQFRLTALSVDLWHALRPELSPDCEFEPRGTLWCAEVPQDQELLADKQLAYNQNGVQAELLDSKQLAQQEPNLKKGLPGALLVPNDAVLYPTNAARWLLAQAESKGAQTRRFTPAQAIEKQTVTLHSREIIQADFIVNAAGDAAPSLTPNLPILPRRGHLAITDRYPGLVQRQVLEVGYLRSAHGSDAPSTAFNVQPRATGQMLIGSSREFAGKDPSVNHPLLAQMLARCIEFIPALAATSVIRVWTGFRPATPDHLPLIGPLPSQPTTLIAAGHEGLGIATSLATARLIAHHALGIEPEIDPTPYLPSRFQNHA